MLHLDDKWIWDSWYVDDGHRYHVFYLQAPSSLSEEAQRHLNVSIGHAVSQDLTAWEVLPDALRPAPARGGTTLLTWERVHVPPIEADPSI